MAPFVTTRFPKPRLSLNALAGTDPSSAVSRRTYVQNLFAGKFVSTAEANRQLHYTWIGCSAGDAAECGGAEASVRLSESRRVGYIE